MTSLSEALKTVVPSIWTCFKSFYYKSTYINPIDLSSVLPSLHCPDNNIIRIAQRITDYPEVRKALSEPFCFNMSEISKNNDILEKNKFHILKERRVDDDGPIVKIYMISEHPELPGWIVKGGGKQNEMVLGIQNDRGEISIPSKFENLLRVVMNQRMREIIQKNGLDIIIPQEYAIPYRNPSNTEDVSQNYFILSQKLNILSIDDTIDLLHAKSKQKQVQIAKKICEFIQKTGFTDANFCNIRMTIDGKFAVIDTEPSGLLKDISERDKTGDSVEKCTRLGLCHLRDAARDANLKEFAAEVDHAYQRQLKNIYSIKKIAVSFFFPILPLIFFSLSLIHRNKIEKLMVGFAESIRATKGLVCDTGLSALNGYINAINGIVFPVRILDMH